MRNMEKNVKTTKKKEAQKTLKNARGITLIALVITIIVLLILAGVSIAMLTGENGILTKAIEARDKTKQVEGKEKLQIEVLGSYGEDGKIDINRLNENLKNLGIENAEITKLPAKVEIGEKNYVITGNGNISDLIAITEAQSDSMLTNTENSAVEDEYGNIVIVPAGFKITEDTTKVIEGIVIEDDNILTNEDGTKSTGNQFVWVPVNFEEFERFDFKNNAEVSVNYTEPFVNGYDGEVLEYQEMIDSVQEHGGFYVGRYEAGCITPRTNDNKTTTQTVVVKKGAYAYNYVPWGSSMNDTESISGSNRGAVDLSKNFAIANDYDTNKVTSTLIYGVQWDAIMRWMQEVPNFTGGKYIQDSTDMGWYSNNYSTRNPTHLTGLDVDSNKSNCVKNIYDLAGNVYEWTMESFSTYNRVGRGGSYYPSGSYDPACFRYSFNPSGSYPSFGFRITLHLL